MMVTAAAAAAKELLTVICSGSLLLAHSGRRKWEKWPDEIKRIEREYSAAQELGAAELSYKQAAEIAAAAAAVTVCWTGAIKIKEENGRKVE